jgi:hypothetical protein
MMRRLLILSLLSFGAAARGDLTLRVPPVRFLGADPIGPLATVEHGVIRRPERRACQKWGPIGSRWSELDQFGAVAGEVEVVQRNFYDYTGCDELSVRRVSGRPGARVYVRGWASCHAPVASRWEPDTGALAALEQLTIVRQKGIVNLDPSHRVPFSKRVMFFDWGAAHAQYAVVGGLSLIVCTRRDGKSVVVGEEKPPSRRGDEHGYRPLAVTDMNGDGRAEIVFHELENKGEWYGDATLSMQADGSWIKVPAGIFGSTA